MCRSRRTISRMMIRNWSRCSPGAHANLLWRNWLNWVYQTTPYDLTEVPGLRAEKKLGTDRSIRHEPAVRARMISSRSSTTATALLRADRSHSGL